MLYFLDRPSGFSSVRWARWCWPCPLGDRCTEPHGVGPDCGPDGLSLCSTCVSGEMACTSEPCPGTPNAQESAVAGPRGCGGRWPERMVLWGSWGLGMAWPGFTAPVPLPTPILAVACGWSPWTPWSVCSRSCDVGLRRRFRAGTAPPAAFGGAACQGPNMEAEFCSLRPCRGKIWDQGPQNPPGRSR